MFSVPHLSADHVPSNRILVTTATVDIEQAAGSYGRNVRNAVDPYDRSGKVAGRRSIRSGIVSRSRWGPIQPDCEHHPDACRGH